MSLKQYDCTMNPEGDAYNNCKSRLTASQTRCPPAPSSLHAQHGAGAVLPSAARTA